MFDESEEERIFKMLEDAGAIYLYGMEGENITYKVNLNIMKEVMPDLYKMITEEVDQELMDLYINGLVDIDYDENLNATFRVTEKGEEYIKNIKEMTGEDNE